MLQALKVFPHQHFREREKDLDQYENFILLSYLMDHYLLIYLQIYHCHSIESFYLYLKFIQYLHPKRTHETFMFLLQFSEYFQFKLSSNEVDN